jgi:hypothetical protein
MRQRCELWEGNPGGRLRVQRPEKCGFTDLNLRSIWQQHSIGHDTESTPLWLAEYDSQLKSGCTRFSCVQSGSAGNSAVFAQGTQRQGHHRSSALLPIFVGKTRFDGIYSG